VSSTIRVAIVGCGGITSAHLNGIRILQQHGLDDVAVTVLCSRNEENAARYNDRNNAPPPLPQIVPFREDPLNVRGIYVSDLKPGKLATIHTDWRRTVMDPNVDAVIILTSVDAHHAVGLGAMTAGKHVYIEKPFAITVRAARKLCEMAEERRLSLGVAESLRYKPETRAVRWALDSSYIGHLEMAVYTSVGAGWSPDKIVGKTAWRHQKLSTGAGILMDIGAHLFDKVRYLCGEPRTISGLVRTIEPLRTTRDRNGEVIEKIACDVEDTAFAHIEFANDAVGTFNMSWAGHGEPSNLTGGMALYGDLGCIKEDRIISDHAGALPLKSTFADKVEPEQYRKWYPGSVEDAFALELHEFFSAIREGRQPETNGVEGLRDIAVGYGIIESSLQHRAVSFADVVNGRLETYQRPINDYYGLRS